MTKVWYLSCSVPRVPETSRARWETRRGWNSSHWTLTYRYITEIASALITAYMKLLIDLIFHSEQKLDFSGIEPEVKPFEEKFGKRILVNCNDLSFNLQSCVAENEEGPTTNVPHLIIYDRWLPLLKSLRCFQPPSSSSRFIWEFLHWCVLQVEPFFVSLSLFDVQSCRKISSDFHVDMNHPSVKALLPSSGSPNSSAAPDSPQGAQPTAGSPTESAAQFPRQVRTHTEQHITSGFLKCF